MPSWYKTPRYQISGSVSGHEQNGRRFVGDTFKYIFPEIFFFVFWSKFRQDLFVNMQSTISQL